MNTREWRSLSAQEKHHYIVDLNERAGLGDPLTGVEEAFRELYARELEDEIVGERELQQTVAEQRAYEGDPARALERHEDNVTAIRAVRTKLATSREGHLDNAAAQVRGREREHLGADAFKAFQAQASAAARESSVERELRELQQDEQRAVERLTVREPSPYEEGSPHSWVCDCLLHQEPALRGQIADRVGISDMRPEAVEARLSAHAKDVRGAIVKGGDYGRHAERMLSERVRIEDEHRHRDLAREQVRNFTAAGGATAAAGTSMSVFVSPAFLLERWAAYRSPYRSFADQCNASVALPVYGMTAYLPRVTTGSSVTTVEGEAVSESSPVATYISSPVANKAGQIDVSQQYLDRAGPGISGDAVLFAQIKDQLAAQVDLFALEQALAGAQTVTDSNAFALTATSGVGGFYGDLKKAKSKLTDTAGVRLRGTHAFATDDFCDYIGAWADAQGRPVFTPDLDDNRLPIRSVGDSTAEGFTGYVVAGLALFADSNIPTVGTTSNTQVIVARPETVYLMEGDAMPYCWAPTLAGSLEAVLGVRCYVAAMPAYPTGIATVSGSAYATSNFS